MASSEAMAISSLTEMQQHTIHARNFLCNTWQLDEKCLTKLPPIFLEEVGGYLGYVDRNITRISISPKLDAGDTQLALVHELVHVERARYNPNEEIWLNEGLAKLSEYIYSTVWPVSYVERLKKNLALNFGTQNGEFQPQGKGYMASFFLVLYLYNHFGQEKLYKKLLTSEKSGWNNVLSAIRELIDEGAVQIPSKFIDKAVILRHFAVSAWINDMFPASYAFFYLDKQYEALAQADLMKNRLVENATEASLSIQYSATYQTSTAKEVYSILSYEPFKIKAAEPEDKALIFIYLFY